MSCVRLQSIYVYTLATDPFRDGIAVCISEPRAFFGVYLLSLMIDMPLDQRMVDARGQHSNSVCKCALTQTSLYAKAYTGLSQPETISVPRETGRRPF